MVNTRSPITQSILAQALQPPRTPVFSAGQGAFQAGTQIISALLAKKLMKQEAADRQASANELVNLLSPDQTIASATPDVQTTPTPIPGGSIPADALNQTADPLGQIKPVIATLLASDNPQMQAIGGNLVASALKNRLQPSTPQVRPATAEERASFLGPENAQNTNIGLEVKLNEQGQPVDFQVADLREKPGTNITVEDKQEGAFASESGKILAGRIGKIIERTDETANSARQGLVQLSQLEGLIDEGVPQGTLADASLPLRSFFNSFGLTDENLPIQQAFKAIATDLGLNALQKFKGSTSEGELSTAQDTVPKLANVEGGNRLIIELKRQTMLAEVVAQESVNQFLEERGGALKPSDAGELQRRIDSAVRESGILSPEYLRDFNKRAESLLGDTSFNFSEMSTEDLKKVDPDILTDDQLDQLINELRKR